MNLAVGSQDFRFAKYFSISLTFRSGSLNAWYVLGESVGCPALPAPLCFDLSYQCPFVLPKLVLP